MLTSSKNKKYYFHIIALISLSILTILSPNSVSAANKTENLYKDGIYCYSITSEEKKEATLIGFESKEAIEVLTIPGVFMRNDITYTITEVNIRSSYYTNPSYRNFYHGINKLNVADNFTGILRDLHYVLPNLTTIEFYGNTPPEKMYISSGLKGKLYIVPKGLENVYEKVIDETFYYSIWSDLYEKSVTITPTIISSPTDIIEYNHFASDGLIYQVIKSGKDGVGKVQLIGVTKANQFSYLKLPETVYNDGYRYQLTKITPFGLIACGASVIVIPDTVLELSAGIIDYKAELIFLSKNCKTLPDIITDENNESRLRFVSVPEGVTTISANAFHDHMINEASIILPSSIKNLGKNALYSFKHITFLNKKPISNIASAIKTGSIVKVNSSAITSYKSVLGNKITVKAAKNVVKATKLTVDKASIKLNTSEMKQLKATLTKGSNETVFWLSSDTNIFEISDQGKINPKKSGSAYAIAYTRTSGLHQAIKVTVTDATITQGIYTYTITNAQKQTVSLVAVKPTSATIRLNIPETILYQGKKYTVTGIRANPNKLNVPLISSEFKKNKIKEIIIPKTITENIGYLGILENIKSITFKGTTAPKEIHWYHDHGYLAFHAMIYVPKNSVKAYTTSLWLNGDDTTYSAKNYGCLMDFNVLEIGNDQLSRFVSKGILYEVTKKAGSSPGTVTVKGADVKLSAINVGGSITFGKYKYNVTEVSSYAFLQSNATSIKLDNTITKVGTHVFNEKVKHIVWSKNCPTIKTGIFSYSNEILRKSHTELTEILAKNDFYALETFLIPKGVTTIERNVFLKGFGNVKSITVPSTVKNIGKDAFKGIANVIYE